MNTGAKGKLATSSSNDASPPQRASTIRRSGRADWQAAAVAPFRDYIVHPDIRNREREGTYVT
jgi:hypothetical protein